MLLHLLSTLKHGPNDDIAGGQEILSFRAPGGGLEGNRRLTATSDFDLTELSALGNSIIGGDGVFPNGPDILTVVANCVDTTGVSQQNPYTITGSCNLERITSIIGGKLMKGLKEFEEICKNLVWRWELVEDETAREALVSHLQI